MQAVARRGLQAGEQRHQRHIERTIDDYTNGRAAATVPRDKDHALAKARIGHAFGRDQQHGTGFGHIRRPQRRRRDAAAQEHQQAGEQARHGQSIDAACYAASRAAGRRHRENQAVDTSAGTGIARRSISASQPRITR